MQQILTFNTNPDPIVAGQQFTVTVFHEIRDTDENVNDLRVRLHFDSSQLSVQGTEVAGGISGIVGDPTNEITDDNNSQTNQEIEFFFNSIGLPPPSLPQENTAIFNVTFNALEGIENTPIVIEGEGEDDFDFSGVDTTLEITNEVTPPPPLPQISLNDISLAEGNEENTEFNFTVSLNEASDNAVTVDFATADDIALAESDYTAVNGTLEFAPGEITKTITVQVTGDTEVEEDETFFLNLSNSNNGEISDDRGIATITNDDSEPVIDVLDININRFQNIDIPGTYLFAGEEESEGIRANFPNFQEEGLAFIVAVEPGDGLIPLYRFQSIDIPGTYLFAGEEERQAINQNFSESFFEEGLAFYVHGVGAGLATEFTRFQNSDRPGTYLFAGPEESEGIRNNFPSFIQEGIAFEAGSI